jgi:Fic-DOC domain mobile mystery protein B
MYKPIYSVGATPLDPDEVEGLIPDHIETQMELNSWEQANINDAELWLRKHNFTTSKILTIEFITQLHRKMFDKTWRWSGQFRKSNKNIGVDKFQINENLKLLLDDTTYHIEHQTYPIDEIAVRFHHRLVTIHLFANGNGRHARLITDLLLVAENQERFSWGSQNLYGQTDARTKYLNALRLADKHNYTLLLQFVRS